MTGRLIAVCGVDREARLIAPHVDLCLMSGGDPAGLERRLEAAAKAAPVAGIVSIGVCGALDPGLQVGDLLCAHALYDGAVVHPVDPAWTQRLATRTGAREVGLILGLDHPASTAKMKRDLWESLKLPVVDMESQVAGRWAASLRVPCVALRVVSDTADQGLPPSAVAGMRADGSVSVGAVVASLVRRPQDLPGLLRLATDTARALRVLARAMDAAGPRLALT